MTTPLTQQLIQAATTADHCQRNWQYEHNIPAETLDTLITVATTMPTKQNQAIYTLVVSTDLEFNQWLYHIGYDRRDISDNMSFLERHRTNTNAQLSANCVFLWAVNTTRQFPYSNYFGDGVIAVGVSAGATALAANQLGLRTGFCVCYDQTLLIPELQRRGVDCDQVAVALGIGYPNTAFKHNDLVIDGQLDRTKNTYTKTISVVRI